MGFAEDLEMILLSMLDEEPTSNPELETLIPNQLLDQDMLDVNLLSSHEIIPHEKSCPRVDHLLPGFRFVPTDQELINGYLNKKINSEQIPWEFIPSINIYMNNPQELTGAHPSLGKNEWYFFTTRDRKYLNGNRPNRTASYGYWKATGADKPIYDGNVHIGFKRSLVFYEGKPKNGKKTNWLMHEYMVDQPPKQKQEKDANNDMLLDNCVLCRIYMNPHRSTKVENESEKQATYKHMRIEQEESYARVDHLPQGFRFIPTDHELINYYLKKKINNEQIPCEFIPSINIYMHNPQELTAAYPSLGNNEFYFFTPRDRKYPNGSRPNRAAGSGHWKATIADKQIYDDNVCIGFMKTLVFYEGQSTEGKKTNWIMHEYILSGQPPSKQQKAGTNDMLLDNCVLCRIYERIHGAAKDHEEQADQETLHH